MPKIKDVVAITGEYNGKPRYKNVGSLIEKDGKQYLKLESLVWHDDGYICNFFSLYDPKPKEGARPAQNAPQDDFDDNGPIPF